MLEKLKNTDFLAKLITISSWVWFIFTLVFIVIIFASTKFITKDPCYGPGCSEYIYLWPMLGSLGLGLLGLGLTVVGAILKSAFKGKNWIAPLGLGAGRMAIASFVVAGLAVVYVVGALRGGVSFGGSYNGEEVFAEVNRHRESVGVAPVKMNEFLCDNLVSRWEVVKDGNYHEGFEQWVKNEGIQTERGFKEVGELVVRADTPKAAIAFWVGSPGHKLVLEGARWTDGCAYANEGAAVVIFSYK